MTRRFAALSFIIGLPVLAALLIAPSVASAQSTLIGDIRIATGWTPATAPGAQTGPVYMILASLGGAGDTLIEARSPIAERVNLRTTVRSDGVVRLVDVPLIDIAARGETVLEPGGFHVTLIGLTEQLVEGGEVPLTLIFERAGPVEVTVTVGPSS